MSMEPIALSTRPNLATAEELVAAAVAYEASTPLEIDASAVEQIDGPVVLALANIAETLSARGVGVAVIRPTPAFVDAFTDLGLFDDFEKMELRQ